MNFDDAFDALLGVEGGYSNSPSDPGGETMWGITRRVALREGYSGDMHLLPRETAKAIYRRRYWDAVMADRLPEAVR
jgi:lysozyme family protein